MTTDSRIIRSESEWTPTNDPSVSLRYGKGIGKAERALGTVRLYRKHVHPMYFGGYSIKAAIAGSRIADEWISSLIG